MNRIVPALVFAVVMFLANAIEATTLTITEGSVVAIWAVNDTFYNLRGDGFSAIGVHLFGGIGLVDRAYTTGFGGTGLDRGVRVGDMSCRAFVIGDACGFILFSSRPLTRPPTGWPSNVPFTDSALFTATGRLNVGDGFDIQGWGTVEGTFCPLCIPTSSSTQVRYTFNVPEPSTLLLLAGGVVTLAGARRVRAFSRRSRPND